MIKTGDILNNTYEVREPIGSGGGGIIFKGYHLRMQIPVAIKLLKKEAQEVIDRRAEVDLLKQLKHEYIPQVFDFVIDNDDVYTIMEFIEGKNFKQLIASGGYYYEDSVVKYAKQLCKAVKYLHRHNPPIIHSDIKPANIMLTPNDDICLIDFNISTAVNGTEAYTVGGSKGFAAPEQFKKIVAVPAADEFHEETRFIGEFDDETCLAGSNTNTGTATLETKNANKAYVDMRTDVYGIGASIYYILTGRMPANGQVDFRGIKVSKKLQNVILKCMNPNPQMRFQTVAELENALGSGHKTLKIAGIAATVAAAVIISVVAISSNNKNDDIAVEANATTVASETTAAIMAETTIETNTETPAETAVGTTTAAHAETTIETTTTAPAETAETTVKTTVTSTEKAITTAKTTRKDTQTSTTGTIKCTVVYADNSIDYTYRNVKFTGEYTGDLVDGVPDGNGTFTGTDSKNNTLVYKGEFQNGKLNGQGSHVYTPKNHTEIITYKYTGEWKNGQINGKGKEKQVYKNGDIMELEGTYKDGWLNGKGTYIYTYANDPELKTFEYVGEWKDGSVSGAGKKTWVYPDGSIEVLECTFIDNLANGQGKTLITYANDPELKTFEYVGEWKDNTFTGKGKKTWTYTDGDTEVLEGTFVNGTINGQGTCLYTYVNDPELKTFEYVGEWKDNTFNGKGKMIWTYKNGETYVEEGTYKDGELIS
ncbi:MAG: protein kinase [Oscillospiraceae bacterium]|nr:protein kinase [Oscillospiraceae bacterium]